MQPGDIFRIKVPSELIGGYLYGAPVYNDRPWKMGSSAIVPQLPDGEHVLVLEYALRVAGDPESGAALILSPTLGVTGWVIDTYLHDFDAVEAA